MQLEAGRDNAAAAVKKYTTITQNLDTTALFTALKARGINIPHVNYKDIYEMELPYNTILSHLEKTTEKAKDYKDFEKKVLALLKVKPGNIVDITLSIDEKDRSLGESLGLNPTSNVNIKAEDIKKVVDLEMIREGDFPNLRRIWESFR